MPAIGFDNVMGFSWPELKEWHGAAFDVFRKIRGIG